MSDADDAVDGDKYPTDSGRRRFVKGVVGGAGLASIGTGTLAAVQTTTARTGEGGGITQAMNIQNTDGPAPRGMPLVPITVEDGFLKGVWPEVSTRNVGGQQVTVAETEDFGGSGVTYTSEWFQYCGVQTYTGVRPEADQDNWLRAAPDPPHAYGWQTEAYSTGDRLRAEDFDDFRNWDGTGIGDARFGKPAMATWRSEDTEATMPVQVLRSPNVIEMRENDSQPNIDFIRAATTESGFIAWLDKCTHFCCVPAFNAYSDSGKFGGENRVYCQCHQSVYNPFEVVQESFVALPRPE